MMYSKINQIVLLFSLSIFFSQVAKSQNEKAVLDSLITRTITQGLTSKNDLQKLAALSLVEKVGTEKFIRLLKGIKYPAAKLLLAKMGDIASLNYIENHLLTDDKSLVDISVYEQLLKFDRTKYFNVMKSRVPYSNWQKSPTAIYQGIKICLATGYVDPKGAQNELNRALDQMRDSNSEWYAQWFISSFRLVFSDVDDSILTTRFYYIEPLLTKFLTLSDKEGRALSGALLLRYNNNGGLDLVEDYLKACTQNDKTSESTNELENILTLVGHNRPQIAIPYLQVMLNNKTHKQVAMKVWKTIKDVDVPDHFLADLMSRIRRYEEPPMDGSYTAYETVSTPNTMSAFCIEMLFMHRYSPYLSKLKVGLKDSLEMIPYYQHGVSRLAEHPLDSDKPILKMFALLPCAPQKGGTSWFDGVVYNANAGLAKLGDREAILSFIKLLKDPNRKYYLKFIDINNLVN